MGSVLSAGPTTELPPASAEALGFLYYLNHRQGGEREERGAEWKEQLCPVASPVID